MPPPLLALPRHANLTQLGYWLPPLFLVLGSSSAGARGLPPTPFLKISATSVDGWKIGGTLFIGGIDARKKALAVADAVRASLLLRSLS